MRGIWCWIGRRFSRFSSKGWLYQSIDSLGSDSLGINSLDWLDELDWIRWID